jgi:hypothetical protein
MQDMCSAGNTQDLVSTLFNKYDSESFVIIQARCGLNRLLEGVKQAPFGEMLLHILQYM